MNKEIGEELGYHPGDRLEVAEGRWATPGQDHRAGQEADRRARGRRIAQLLRRSAEKLVATSVYELLKAEGFSGSYPSVAHYLREVRGPRARAAPAVSVPIETAPGEEARFDWSDGTAWTSRWGLGEVWCFGCIWCWSRWKRWWFTTSVDAEHTFEGLGELFRSFRLHPPAIDFARWHHVEIKACQAGDAKRNGKCERSFRRLKESFLTEVDATGATAIMAELNHRGEAFLAQRVHLRKHHDPGSTGQALEVERLFPAPPVRSAFRHRLPAGPARPSPPGAGQMGRGVPYSVPREVLGCKLTGRLEVASDLLEVSWGSWWPVTASGLGSPRRSGTPLTAGRPRPSPWAAPRRCCGSCRPSRATRLPALASSS
jgi:transposase